MKISKDMIKYVAIAILLVVVCVLLAKSCRISPREARLEAEIVYLKDTFIQNEHTMIVNKEKYDKEIATLTEENRQKDLQISISIGKISNRDGNIETLESNLTTLRSEAETIPNLKEQIHNLELQVSEWTSKFHIAEEIIRDKDVIIFNLKQQYELQVAIFVDLEATYEAQKGLLVKTEDLLKVRTRKLRVSKFGGTFKTIALGVIGGYIGYKLLLKDTV